MVAYSLLDRALHRAALQVASLAELSFDLDQRLLRSQPEPGAEGRHLFVSGLARAGTTILMRRFHESGAFRSLTYRDMPFVLAPNLWRRLARRGKAGPAAERAHGDGILVDLDSPESLDEVFWRIFEGEHYIAQTHLAPHRPDLATQRKYRAYVQSILRSGQTPATRYLSKNNNNLLRLKAIRRMFPDAIILVPFRHPLAQASSLLRQHRNFIAQQNRDRFVTAYMGWLGHHEFGLDHRPFRFDATGAAQLQGFDTQRTDYWLALWCQTYGWLERQAPRDTIFISYEALCNDDRHWTRLTEIVEIEPLSKTAEPFLESRASAEGNCNSVLLRQAETLYQRLEERAFAAPQSVGESAP